MRASDAKRHCRWWQGRKDVLRARQPAPAVPRWRVLGPGAALWQTAVVSDNSPDLHMLNLVVDDMPASLDFYRRLGVTVPAGEGAAGAHVQLKMPGGFSLELDTAKSASLWHAGWRANPCVRHNSGCLAGGSGIAR